MADKSDRESNMDESSKTGTTSRDESLEEESTQQQAGEEQDERKKDAIKRAEERLRNKQKELDDLPEGHKMRLTIQIELACFMADLVAARKDTDAEYISEAADMARSTLAACPEDSTWLGFIASGTSAILETLYGITHDPNALEEAIEASRRAVAHRWIEHNEEQHRRLFARRSANLSRQLYAYYQNPATDAEMSVLTDATTHAGNAADHTNAYTSDRATRLQTFTDLQIERAILLDDVSMIDGLIDLREQEPDLTKEPGYDNDEEGAMLARKNRIALIILRCYRYCFSREAGDLDRVVQAAKSLDGDERDRVACIGLAAQRFEDWELAGLSSPSICKLETLEILYKAMLAELPKRGLEHVKRRAYVLPELSYVLHALYRQTNRASYGWEVDDLAFAGASTNSAINTSEGEGNDETLEPTPGIISVCHGMSVVLGKMLCKPGTRFDPELDGPIDLERVWPLFIGDVVRENYIRKRNDDGTVELGFTDEDEEISEWWRRYHASSSS